MAQNNLLEHEPIEPRPHVDAIRQNIPKYISCNVQSKRYWSKTPTHFASDIYSPDNCICCHYNTSSSITATTKPRILKTVEDSMANWSSTYLDYLRSEHTRNHTKRADSTTLVQRVTIVSGKQAVPNAASVINNHTKHSRWRKANNATPDQVAKGVGATALPFKILNMPWGHRTGKHTIMVDTISNQKPTYLVQIKPRRIKIEERIAPRCERPQLRT